MMAGTFRELWAAGAGPMQTGSAAGPGRRGARAPGLVCRPGPVALGRRGGAYADGLVGELVVQGVPVGGGVDRHAPYAELTASPDDAERYLPPVRDEDLADHLGPVAQR